MFSLFSFLLALSCAEPTKTNSSNNGGVHTEDTAEERDLTPLGDPICGYQVNALACNFIFSDQTGGPASLHEHLGKTIILDFSTMWCMPCNAAAYYEPKILEYFENSGENVVWVTVLVENSSGETVSHEEAEIWALTYGLDSPVLAGNDSVLDLSGSGEGYSVTGWPTFFIIDENMIIKESIAGFGGHGQVLIEKVEEFL